jgi:hypothetical protein
LCGMLTEVAEPLTIAAWLSSPQPSLDGERPYDLLRAGDQRVEPAARRLAESLRR